MLHAATVAFMRSAERAGASLLERHLAIERFAETAARALTRRSCPREEIVEVRRLFASLDQRQLADAGWATCDGTAPWGLDPIAPPSQGRAAQAEHEGMQHRRLMEEPTLIIQEEPPCNPTDVVSRGRRSDVRRAGRHAVCRSALRHAGGGRGCSAAARIRSRLRFVLAPSPARVEVLLCDIEGIVISRMTPSRALEIATGSPVVGGTR